MTEQVQSGTPMTEPVQSRTSIAESLQMRDAVDGAAASRGRKLLRVMTGPLPAPGPQQLHGDDGQLSNRRPMTKIGE